ncbi:MAG: urate oxidase [Actinomycetota bacterium]|nr:urate oxidase [Actinomycetota bacterium]
MSIVLGPNQYGKAENRVVRVYRDTARHEIRDLNVTTELRGDFTDAHVTGDQAKVLPTDTQKNTAFAFAKEKGIGTIEEYAITLGSQLIDTAESSAGVRVEVEEYGWDRIEVGGQGHDHAFTRTGGAIRNTVVNIDGRGDDRRVHVVSGLSGLVIAKTTESEFNGFLRDKYTTLADTDDRILATSLVARWRYNHPDVDYDASFAATRQLLLQTFATTHSYALQQSLFTMGKALLENRTEIAEIKFSAPNKHHFLVDLSPFGLENPGEVFIAADRPYGLIELTVLRDDATDAGSAWWGTPGFC